MKMFRVTVRMSDSTTLSWSLLATDLYGAYKAAYKAERAAVAVVSVKLHA